MGLEALPKTFKQAEAARAGIAPATLYRHLDAGRVERIAHGLYRRTDAAEADHNMLVATRTRNATLCLTTALAHHGLVDTIPGQLDVAIPRTQSAPRGMPAIRWHRFDTGTFRIGRGTHTIPGTTEQIGLYSAERSIIDAFRLRGQEGYEIGVEALRTWLRRRGSNPGALMRMASEIPRAEGPLRQALTLIA